MSRPKIKFLALWRNDVPAAMVVFLLALPLTLGIALASGVPMFSGIITAVVGGLVVPLISKSPLNISGPAASIAVIVLSTVQMLPSFKAFLLAVVLAGVIQVVLGIVRAGVVGALLPASVIKGMLAAIGITIVLVQIPHALGYDKSAYLSGIENGDGFWHFIQSWQNQFSLEAVIIAVAALFTLMVWQPKRWKNPHVLQYLPGSLLAIIIGTLINLIFQAFIPRYALSGSYFVQVPVIDSPEAFLLNFNVPDFNYITHLGVWSAAISLAIIASIQTILGVEGVDKLDPLRRKTPLNRELLAQGVGNIASGLLGGIILTSVIVRSLANVNAGARTRASAFLQGSFLMVFVLAFPFILNQIPLAALATVLVFVGFQLVKPAVFIQGYKKGWAYFIPFITTVIAILWTDLLTGVCTGLIASVIFILRNAFKPLYAMVQQEGHLFIRFEKDLTFIQKYELTELLKTIPSNIILTFDFSRLHYIDEDNAAMLLQFIDEAPQHNIEVIIHKEAPTLNDVLTASVYKLT